jgi:DNA-binding NarL/FixJ family response regulator
MDPNTAAGTGLGQSRGRSDGGLSHTPGPDWLSMDILMTGIDGISATRQIKQAFPQARIIVDSLHNDPEMREEARRPGAVSYLRKDEHFSFRK